MSHKYRQKNVFLPFIVVGIVALDVVDGRDAVEAADDEDHVVEDRDAKVAAVDVHAGRGRPLYHAGLPSLHGVQASQPVESANRIHGVSVRISSGIIDYVDNFVNTYFIKSTFFYYP